MRLSSSRSFLSIATLLVCLVFISGCRYLIPEDPSAPRYNSVLGGKRAPEKNDETMHRPIMGTNPLAAVEPVPTAPVYAANAMPPTTMMEAPSYPPVSAQTEAIAEQRLQPPANYEAAYVPPPTATGERSFWDRMAFWREDPQPTAQDYARMQAAQRQAPEENVQPVRMASVGYPQLSTVPQAPMSDAARLSAVRNQLEQDRNAAAMASQQLGAAAAAEPSLLSPMPVASAPLPPPAPMTPMPMPSAAAPSGLEPITLRPPQPAYSAPYYR